MTTTTPDDFWGRAYRGRTDHLWHWSDDTEYTTLCGLWQRTREVWKHSLKRCRKCEQLIAKEQSMITYKEQSDLSIAVLLDGKRVGTIRNWGHEGWQYRAKGDSFGGEYFDTLDQCKRSLESDDVTPSTSAGGG